MKPDIFDIVLTKKDAVYFSGQTLQGHVMIELNKSLKVKGIRLVIKGKAFVHWTDQLMRGPGETRFKEVRHHSSTEDYIDFSQSLLSKDYKNDHNGNSRALDAGQFTYPFQFIIPKTSPSSFEGQYGYIRYWLKACIERPWKEDISIKKMFTVICPVDLNRDDSCSQPAHNQSSKQLCCACCVSGPLSAYIRLSHKGYVPGEALCVFAEINNNTRREISTTSIELLMTTTFRATTKSRSITQQVAKLQHGKIPPGRSDTWEWEQLFLPSLPPSFLIGCSIMNIRYILELRVFPGGPAFELAVPLEILIGTVPLHSTVQRYWSSHHVDGPSSSATGASAEGTQRQPLYLYPTFSSSSVCRFHVRDDEDDHITTMIDKDFSPSYINFNFRTTPHPYRPQQTIRFST